MSITINAFCLSHHLEELKKHSPKYLKMKIDELPGSTITPGDNEVTYDSNNKFTYTSKEVTFNSIDTIYHILIKIDPINISLRQWINILNIISITPHNVIYKKIHRPDYSVIQNRTELKSNIDILGIDRHSAIVYKCIRHMPIYDDCSNDTRICTKYTSNMSITSPEYQFPVSRYKGPMIKQIPINMDYTFSDHIRYIVLNVDAYDSSHIESLKRIHHEMTDEPPIIGWDDDKLEYIHRTDDDSPFITKSELWELIQKLERGEDILPKKRTPNPTPIKEITPPELVKSPSKNMEPGRIRPKKSASPPKIKEAIKETTGYVNPYEGLDETSSSDDSIDTTDEILEQKTKIDPKMLDCIAFDHEPVKPLRLSYTAENINIFLVIYAFIMTALVTIGMARR